MAKKLNTEETIGKLLEKIIRKVDPSRKPFTKKERKLAAKLFTDDLGRQIGHKNA